MNVLIISRNKRRVEREIKEIRADFEEDFTFYSATSHVSMRDVFTSNRVDIVIMSGGHEAVEKANFVDYIIRTSPGTTVHIKDSDTGHKGMVPFIRGLLDCMRQGGLLQERLAVSK